MTKRKAFLLALFTGFFLTGFHVASSQTAIQDSRNTDFANVTAAGATVRWDVRAPHAGSTLVISTPDGRVFRKDLRGSAVPEFTLADKDGGKLPDGQYTYELRLTPVLSQGAKEELAITRGKDDDPEALRSTRKRVVLQPMVQSGAFSVINGFVIVAGASEESGPRAANRVTQQPRVSEVTAAARAKLRQHHLARLSLRSAVFLPDQVIPDDLIVQGSICAGLDCVNNENFGFDTIRMKENNTRLQFDDTSVSAGFATNNWQIRANASPSGGGNFLGFVDQGANGSSETGTIVFQVDAGAPANSLRVSSIGKVGIKTATPVLDVHMNSGDTPATRYEQNNTGGFTAQTWDVAGNEANFFIRDVTSGSRLPFRIRPGAPTSSIDIAASGNVGIGTQAPGYKLEVFGASYNNSVGIVSNNTIGPGLTIRSTDAGGREFNILSTASAANPGAGFLAFFDSTTGGAAGYRMVIGPTGNVGIGTIAPTDLLSVNGTASKPGGGSWAVFSDERLKTFKGQFTRGLQAVMKLQPLRFEYKQNNAAQIRSEGEHVGFGAQALQKVIPEAVTRNAEGYLLVNNDPIIWTMLNAIKEQQQQIEELKRQVSELRANSRKEQ
jgi:hypothetical protein